MDVLADLDTVWSRIKDSQVLEARELLNQIKDRIGIDQASRFQEWIDLRSRFQAKSIIDILVFDAIILARQGDIESSRHLLGRSEEMMTALNVHTHYPFFLVKSQEALVSSNQAECLKYAVLAVQYSKTPQEYLWGMMHVLITLENQGQRCDSCLMKIQECLLSNPDLVKNKKLQQQLTAFEYRQLFRFGKIDELFARPTSTADSSGQESLFHLWVSELPYHAGYRCSEEDKRFFLQLPKLNKSFHARTFQGTFTEDDLDFPDICDRVSRFYLWTWRWLTNPGEMALEKILIQLKSMNLDTWANQLKAVNSHMLANSLMWLGLFDPANAPKMWRLAQFVQQPNLHRFPLLELETLLISYIRAMIAEDREKRAECLVKMTTHSLWNKDSIYFRQIVEVLENNIPIRSSALREMGMNLKQLCEEKCDEDENVIVVDVSRNTIYWHNQNHPLISPQIVAALILLKDQTSVPVHQFFAACMGIRRFDAVVHRSRLFNLLTRLKRLAPRHLNFGMKDDQVFRSGNWKLVKFIRNSALSKEIQESDLWKVIIGDKTLVHLQPRPSQVSSVNAFVKSISSSAYHDSYLSRIDIQKEMRFSKAKTLRYINQCIKNGSLKRSGSGRHTLYSTTG